MNNPAAPTALAPMIIVAAEQHESSPLIHDPWAQRLLPLSGRIPAGITRWFPAGRRRVNFTAWSQRRDGRCRNHRSARRRHRTRNCVRARACCG